VSHENVHEGQRGCPCLSHNFKRRERGREEATEYRSLSSLKMPCRCKKCLISGTFSSIPLLSTLSLVPYLREFAEHDESEKHFAHSILFISSVPRSGLESF